MSDIIETMSLLYSILFMQNKCPSKKKLKVHHKHVKVRSQFIQAAGTNFYNWSGFTLLSQSLFAGATLCRKAVGVL